MKTYSLIAAVTMTLLLNSCSDNDEQTTYISPTKMENTKLDEMFDREGDTIVKFGEPVPPKPKG